MARSSSVRLETPQEREADASGERRNLEPERPANRSPPPATSAKAPSSGSSPTPTATASATSARSCSAASAPATITKTSTPSAGRPAASCSFSQGLHAHSRVETPHGIVALDHAGFLRFRPREQRLDAFYGGHADPQNPWGFVWTDWGQMLMVAGNNGGIYLAAARDDPRRRKTASATTSG